ncbi:MAG: hypothetical protein C4560_01315 [Nitrospiraceae bacterium]|nr:MAG: hypothetical protein C4560_01315 [Nitrospiraceae bacterium]
MKRKQKIMLLLVVLILPLLSVYVPVAFATFEEGSANISDWGGGYLYTELGGPAWNYTVQVYDLLRNCDYSCKFLHGGLSGEARVRSRDGVNEVIAVIQGQAIFTRLKSDFEGKGVLAVLSSVELEPLDFYGCEQITTQDNTTQYGLGLLLGLFIVGVLMFALR